eukprot:GHVT01058966.1.p3 GENE.GHVT01058966.1~~GHVT01058966.1.p3  ORF type:complete len:105 (+),score=4.09 GHVT01058966.1:613-927(+)
MGTRSNNSRMLGRKLSKESSAYMLCKGRDFYQVFPETLSSGGLVVKTMSFLNEVLHLVAMPAGGWVKRDPSRFCVGLATQDQGLLAKHRRLCGDRDGKLEGRKR